MYSVKPGRGPSMMGVVAGIAAAAFGVFWTFGAMSMGAPPFLGLFGVVFVVLAIVGVGYNLFNATSRDRMSTLDIT
ncbi:MAG: zinc ribbon domain-containing protein, partial [bacterium]|nr:zinc ribbon domain-containing protein [bacterium]